MARAVKTYRRAGDTEPLYIEVGAQNLTTLANLVSAVLYARAEGADTNHVDGVLCTVQSSTNRILAFDPVSSKVGGGNAFDAAGTYFVYVKLVWSDGDITRHPDGADFLPLYVTETYE